MERKIEHFSDRLEKETYTKDDVAKLLFNEASYTETNTKKSFDGMVSRDEFDTINTELSNVKAELEPYKEAEFNEVATTEFTKLNGNADRYNDFKTLAGITGSEDAETITSKILEFKDNEKYDFMFTKTNSGGAKQVVKNDKSPKSYNSGAFTPSMGGYNLFKRKK